MRRQYGGGVTEGLAGIALGRPRLLLGAAIGLLAAFVRVGAAAPDRLAVGSEQLSGAPPHSFLLVTTGDAPVKSRVYGVALSTVTSQLHTDPAVAGVSRGPVSEDRHTTALVVDLRSHDPADDQRAAKRIAGSVDPGPLPL